MNVLSIANAEEWPTRIGAEVWAEVVKVSGKANTGKGAKESMQNIQFLMEIYRPMAA